MPAIYKSDTGRRRVEESYRTLLGQWPVPAERLTVPTRHGETFVLASGPEDAPPLILLHGSMANATTWFGEIADYVAKFRCYCVDIIGEPGLSAPVRPDFMTDAYVLWMGDVLDQLGIDRAAFVTVSLGGLIAFQFGAAHPERTVALAGNAPAGICRNRNFILRYLPFFFLGDWGKRKTREAVTGKLPTDVSPQAREIWAHLDLIVSHFNPRIFTLPVLSDEEIKNLHFPIYVIVGGRDVMLHTEETRDRLQALAPDAAIDFRPEARHYTPMTQKSILPFLLDVHGLDS